MATPVAAASAVKLQAPTDNETSRAASDHSHECVSQVLDYALCGYREAQERAQLSRSGL
jgi:hypothetical protein